MSTNGTTNIVVDNDNKDEIALGWVALVISLVALIGTTAQVLQQYYASATGFANCGENVMGLWWQTTKRIFLPTEWRFEVQFEAPVIFVCPPENTKGPVKGQPIHFVSGTPKSYENTRTLPAGEEEKQRQQPSRENRVHTADNERATWVTLLSQLHTMERDSRDWQEQHYPSDNTSDDETKEDAEAIQNPELKHHTLAVALQAKKRSWDNMPTDVKKPYATTTICHLLEIAAMMGIYWKEWDRSKDRYRAEGNGFILTGTQITDLGLMFAFQISGGSRFHENRVIPVDEVKELCCGSVSTIFRAGIDVRRLGVVNEDPRDLGILQVGSLNEIAETMVLIDCNTITASYFRQADAKHGHLFPVPFELVGMLCKSLHIKKTPFRMLPNPTPYHWDKNFFNMRKLINEYHKRITELKGVPDMGKFQILAGRVVDALKKNKHDENQRRLEERKLVQKTVLREKEKLEKKSTIKVPPKNGAGVVPETPKSQPPQWLQTLWSKLKPAKQPARDVESQSPEPAGGKAAPGKAKKSRPGYNMDLLDALDAAIAECDEYLLDQDRALVRTVIREHFQEVLKLVNGGDDDDEVSIQHPPRKKTDEAAARRRRAGRKFEELSAASPEDRQRLFMDIYFTEILHEVKKRAASSFSKMTFYHTNHHHQRSPSEELLMASSPTTARLLQPPDVTSGDPSDAESDTGGGVSEAAKAKYHEPNAASIWCVLIFRMLCWLTLHDFDKGDLQISKSELLGSRLPVYIS